ncbi:MAG TPA: c-type cytochrome domain-containing protein [Planctomycetaceae bacterium]|nr:c-type cytochrome domain-containing protein [Planctomycetaceae bacterium]
MLHRLSIAFGLLAALLARSASAQDEAALQAAANEAKAKQTAGEPAIKATRDQAKQLTDAVIKLKLELSKAEATVKDLEAKLPKLKEALPKPAEERTKAQAENEAAAKAAEEAKGKDNEKDAADKAKAAADKLAAAVKAHDDANTAVTMAEQGLAAAKQTVADHPAKIQAAEKVVEVFTPELAKAEAAYAALAGDALGKLIALETHQVAAGKRVSFAKQVAPVFAQRCVACHNARTAKGRFNLETFANMMKGGESGPSIVPGKGGDSNLCIEIESGSMPKDADPLTPEQIAVVKKWIDLGAPLDAGVAPNAPLITIIPKLAQPNPPESYRVPVPVLAVAISPDGTLIASAGYREVILWNAADGALVRRITNLAERPHDIEFTANGQQLIVAAGTPGQMGEVKIFNVADGVLVADLFTTDDEVFSVALNADGSRLAASCADRSLRVFDMATRKQQLFVEDHADWVMDVAWSPDGTKLATASRDKTSKVFDAKTGEALATFNGHANPVFSVGFLPDSNQVVSGGRDNKLRVWAVAEAKQAREIGGFGGEVFRLTVLPDGHSLTTSADKQIRLHNLANGQQVRAFAGHNEWVYAVAYHASSKRVISGSHDGEIQVWNFDDGKSLLKFIAAPGFKPATTAAK